MTKRLHEIRAAIPCGIAVGSQLVRAQRREKPIPDGERPALIEWERHAGGRRHAAHRRHALHHVRVQRAHVVVGDLGERGVGHRRIEPLAARRHAFAQRTREIVVAVVADAVALVGRNVAADDRAERRVHLQPARVGRAVPGGGVAAGAIRGLR